VTPTGLGGGLFQFAAAGAAGEDFHEFAGNRLVEEPWVFPGFFI